MAKTEKGEQLLSEIRAMALAPRFPRGEQRAELAVRCRELADSAEGKDRDEWNEIAQLIEDMKW